MFFKAYHSIFIPIILLPIAIFSQKQDSLKLKDKNDSLSYIIGRDVGQQLKTLGFSEIRSSPLTKGIEHGFRNQKSLIDSSKADSLRQGFATRAQEHLMAEQKKLEDQGKVQSDKFLEQNKKKSGVKTTKTGLQYRVLTKGSGPSPKNTDSVLVNYRVLLPDSTVIDSTFATTPSIINLSQTIPGLAEGIQLMNKGARYMFYIPPALAYGAQGAPPQIKPNSILVFDVTLREINAKAGSPAPTPKQ